MTNYSKTKRKRKPLRQFHANSHTSDPWSEKAKVLTENVCKQQKEVLFGSYYLKSHSLEFHTQTQKEEAFGRAHLKPLKGNVKLNSKHQFARLWADECHKRRRKRIYFH